jgi:hypothetical protein
VAWEIAWHELTSLERYYFLQYVKVPEKTTARRLYIPHVLFPPDIAQSLKSAGFIEIHAARLEVLFDSVVLNDEAYDFAVRAQTLRRFRLLD